MSGWVPMPSNSDVRVHSRPWGEGGVWTQMRVPRPLPEALRLPVCAQGQESASDQQVGQRVLCAGRAPARRSHRREGQHHHLPLPAATLSAGAPCSHEERAVGAGCKSSGPPARLPEQGGHT